MEYFGDVWYPLLSSCFHTLVSIKAKRNKVKVSFIETSVRCLSVQCIPRLRLVCVASVFKVITVHPVFFHVFVFLTWQRKQNHIMGFFFFLFLHLILEACSERNSSTVGSVSLLALIYIYIYSPYFRTVWHFLSFFFWERFIRSSAK